MITDPVSEASVRNSESPSKDDGDEELLLGVWQMVLELFGAEGASSSSTKTFQRPLLGSGLSTAAKGQCHRAATMVNGGLHFLD